MLIGIISDAHLFNRYAITAEEYKNTINKMFDKLGVDFVVDCGDITDKSTITAPQLDAFGQIFRDLKKPVYIVAGNHDSLSNTSVAAILKLNPNVKVITTPTLIGDNLLFVPYTDENTRNLYKKLEFLTEDKDTSSIFMFSHLNITNLYYSTIPFDKLSNMFKYANVIFNGHIHINQQHEDIYGTFYNVGSCSSITFGDEHTPNYCVFNTDTLELHTYDIKGSIIHRTFLVTKDNIDVLLNDISNLSVNFRVRCRFKVPNSPESVELKKKIKDYFSDNENVISIVFDYVKDDAYQKELKKKQEKDNKLSKVPLIQQLFEHFEQDTGIKLDDEIKKGLAND